MITNNIIEKLYSWFNKYTETFFNQSAATDLAVRLKIDHTFRVCHDNKILCTAINADTEVIFMSTIVALLHDVGRFEQFQKYNTFADRHSVNHATLAIEIIERYNLLADLSSLESDTILSAIQMHNIREIPVSLDDRQRKFCNLIRDADKIDIYKITAEYYKNPNSAESEIMSIGIKDTPEISDEVCDAIINKKNVDFSLMRSLNDFKLVQLGWVYDFNFPVSLSIIKSRGHYDTIKLYLPDIPKTRQVLNAVDAYMEGQIQLLNASL
jgi:hypothetical protein